MDAVFTDEELELIAGCVLFADNEGVFPYGRIVDGTYNSIFAKISQQTGEDY